MSAVGSKNTQSKYSGLIPWKPGQSGNPAGKPKGSRNKLGEDFVHALQESFKAHGRETLEIVRVEDPSTYVRVIASLLPKQLEIKESAFAGIGDDELAALVAAARSALGVLEGGTGGITITVGSQSTSEL